MPDALLNDNQQRHLATFINLLAADLAQLNELGLHSETLRKKLDAVDHSLKRIADALALPRLRQPDSAHRVRVLAGVWAMRAHDLHAARLRSHGTVHPDLPERLDPLVDELQLRLYDLADVAPSESSEDRGAEPPALAPVRHRRERTRGT